MSLRGQACSRAVLAGQYTRLQFLGRGRSQTTVTVCHESKVTQGCEHTFLDIKVIDFFLNVYLESDLFSSFLKTNKHLQTKVKTNNKPCSCIVGINGINGTVTEEQPSFRMRGIKGITSASPLQAQAGICTVGAFPYLQEGFPNREVSKPEG